MLINLGGGGVNSFLSSAQMKDVHGPGSGGSDLLLKLHLNLNLRWSHQPFREQA